MNYEQMWKDLKATLLNDKKHGHQNKVSRALFLMKELEEENKDKPEPLLFRKDWPI